MTVGHCAAVGEGGEMNQETGGDAGWTPRLMGYRVKVYLRGSANKQSVRVRCAFLPLPVTRGARTAHPRST
eukprot:scaffold38257_cov63-Phaeocystis_antarctica.AAC.2